MTSLYTYKTKTPKSKRKTLQNKDDELLFKEKPKKILNFINKIENSIINLYNDTCFIENYMYNLKDTKDVKNTFDNINYEINNIISDVKLKKNIIIKCPSILEGQYSNMDDEEWKNISENLYLLLESKNKDGIYINDCVLNKNKKGECTIRGLMSFNDIKIKSNIILEKSINKKFDIVKLENNEIYEYLKKWNINKNIDFYVKNNITNNKGEQNFLQFLKLPFN